MSEQWIYQPMIGIPSEGSNGSHTNRILTVHFGIPARMVVPPVPRPDVRWKPRNWSESDFFHAKLGARSMMFVGPSRSAQSGEGIDDTDFAREGLPDESGLPGDSEWGQ